MNCLLLFFCLAILVTFALSHDFGMITHNMFIKQALNLTGFSYLDEWASQMSYSPRANATAADRVKLSDGLGASFVSRNVAHGAGKMACKWLEQKRSDKGNGYMLVPLVEDEIHFDNAANF